MNSEHPAQTAENDVNMPKSFIPWGSSNITSQNSMNTTGMDYILKKFCERKKKQ